VRGVIGEFWSDGVGYQAFALLFEICAREQGQEKKLRIVTFMDQPRMLLEGRRG
jgi:hypothetical protein